MVSLIITRKHLTFFLEQIDCVADFSDSFIIKNKYHFGLDDVFGLSKNTNTN